MYRMLMTCVFDKKVIEKSNLKNRKIVIKIKRKEVRSK